MTTKRKQYRAVFLAALMVLSVLAFGSFGLVGSAAADDGDEERTLADYAGEEGVVGTNELREAIDDWRDGTIDTNLLRDVIDAWRSGEPLTGDLTVSVTNQAGAPIEGATVTVEETEVVGAASIDEPVTTGEDGTYTFEGVEPGDYAVTVEYEDAFGHQVVEVVAAETATADFELTVELDDATIEGTVTDAEGEPIENAEIVTIAGESLATTGADGTYAATVEPGEYTIRATATGYEKSSLKTVAVGEAETAQVDFELEADVEEPTAEFDLNDIEGQQFEQGETYEDLEAGIEVAGEFDADADYTVQLSAENPDGDAVDIGAQENFAVESVEIPGFGMNVDDVVEDAAEDGVFYLNATADGETLTDADSTTALVTITVDDDAAPGTYTFETALVELAEADGFQAADTIGEPATAEFEVLESVTAEFDLSDIEGQQFEQGVTYENLEAGIEVAGEFDADADYTVQLSAENPDNDTVNIGAEEGFEIDNVEIPGFGMNVEDVVEDAAEDGVFYLNATADGETLTDADSTTALVTITVDDDAAPGTYTFETALVELAEADGFQAADTIGEPATAEFEVVK